MPYTTYGPGDPITYANYNDPQLATDDDECPTCGTELDRDCWGEFYCPACDGPCDGCRDY